MSDVLVTGATGFVGGHLCQSLRDEGLAVRAIVRDRKRVRRLIEAGVEIIEGDVADAKATIRACQDCAVVYHLASVLGPAHLPEERYWHSNVEGTRTMLEAARAASVRRFVHVSSVAVLGSLGKRPVKEDAPLNPGDVYERTKAEAETLALASYAEGMPVVIARPAWVYGPGDRRTLKLFRAIYRKRFILVGRCDGLQHPVHVDDLVDGLRLCGEKPAANGEIFHLGGAEIVSIRELCEAIARSCGRELPRLRAPVTPMRIVARLTGLAAKMIGRESPLDIRKLDFFLRNRAYRIEKARELLGYQPRISLCEGLAQTADWYIKEGWL